MNFMNRMAPVMKKALVVVLAMAMFVSSIVFSNEEQTFASTTIGSASDYKVTATDVSSSVCKITFTPESAAAYVIIHYKVNQTEQVNIGMNANGTDFTYDITGLKTGDNIE